MQIGIESINAYVGQTTLDIRTLFQERGLDMSRYDNLMMQQKTVGLPFEDPVTNAVNAAKPLIDQLSEKDKNKIELVITATESGLDFGKSLSTYIHKYLGLSRNCRLFEVKQACYASTAALEMAAAVAATQQSPGSKALVVSTDVARAAVKMTYAEPSQGAGAIAMLIGEEPQIMELDLGANGYYGYEILDTFRPDPEIETGDPDLSLLSYLDCLDGSFKAYCDKVADANFQTTFDYLAFHTPFAGMVKGAHRKMMRELIKATPEQIENDFQKRVYPSLHYCMLTGNLYSGSLYLALCGLIDTISLKESARIGLFSYGSGCSSEFYSGVINPNSQLKLKQMNLAEKIKQRYTLSMAEYEKILNLSMPGYFGFKDREIDIAPLSTLFEKQFANKGLLILKNIKDYQRQYEWS